MSYFFGGLLIGLTVACLAGNWLSYSADKEEPEDEVTAELVAKVIEWMESTPDDWVAGTYETSDIWFLHEPTRVCVDNKTGQLSLSKDRGGCISTTRATKKRLYKAVTRLKGHKALRLAMKHELKSGKLL